MWIEQFIATEAPGEKKDSTELNQEIFNINSRTSADMAAFEEATETWDYRQLARAPFYRAQLDAFNNVLAKNPNCDLNKIDIAGIFDLSWEMTEAQKATMNEILKPILPEMQLAVKDWTISGIEFWRIIQVTVEAFSIID